MTEFDKEYLRLLREILNNGVEVENRTGINTIKIPEFHFSFDLNHEFPILQTKQMFYRQAVTEMLWIWQMGSNDVENYMKEMFIFGMIGHLTNIKKVCNIKMKR